MICFLYYVGVDPKKLSGEARMYCGGFDKYPQDNLIRVYNPAGSVSKKSRCRLLRVLREPPIL